MPENIASLWSPLKVIILQCSKLCLSIGDRILIIKKETAPKFNYISEFSDCWFCLGLQNRCKISLNKLYKNQKKKNQRINSIQSHEVNYSIMWLSITSYGAIDISDLFGDVLES